jgi:hypothetical protein
MNVLIQRVYMFILMELRSILGLLLYLEKYIYQVEKSETNIDFIKK